MKRSAVAGLLCAASALAVAAPAWSHISLEKGGTHLSRYGDGEIKAGPCGRKDGARGTNIYTYEPGQTITVSVVEFIPHPGYFRIAFDADGDDGFIEPASILPVDPNRKCPSSPTDQCGASDFYNSPEVLPGMDNLDPHLASGVKTYTWQVTLPNVECSNCTLQVIQVMEDDLFHGPYDPTPGVGIEDVYHQCIDLVLKHDPSSPAGGGGAAGAGGAGGGGGASGASSTAGGANSGSSGGGAGGAAAGGQGSGDGTAVDGADTSSGGCAVGAPAGARAGRWGSGLVALGIFVGAGRGGRGGQRHRRSSRGEPATGFRR
jgi:hypothetical protein